MNITEQEMRGLITGKAMPSDIFVGESLSTYLVRKFAVLTAERDALAAENAALQGFTETISEIRTDLIGGGHGSAHRSDMQAGSAVLDTVSDAFADIKTPAIDAYLNSVRADAVVNAAAHLGDMASGKSASTAELIKSCGRALLAFAAQLRAGEPS